MCLSMYVSCLDLLRLVLTSLFSFPLLLDFSVLRTALRPLGVVTVVRLGCDLSELTV